MPITLDAPPLADFDRPIDMMEDCHRRIEQFLRLLQSIVVEATGDGRMTEDAARALTVALRYFRNAAPKHTADEEESLFPRMRASGDPRVEAVFSRIASLEQDHLLAEELHEVADELGTKWLETGILAEHELRRLATVLEELRAIYDEHITLEDSEIFPLARQVIDADTQQLIGEEMRARRGGSCSERTAAATQQLAIDPQTTLSQLVIDVPARSRVFESHGMDFCCGGGVTLEQACADAGLGLDDLVAELAAVERTDTDGRDWSTAPIEELARHIVETHHARLAQELPHVQELVAKVARAHGARLEGLVEARVVFDRMAAALREHTDIEEQELFPHLATPPADEDARCALLGLLRRATDDHDEVAGLFAQLHELLDDFTPPEGACTSHRAMLDGLQRLERDLHVHVHQENHILFPRAIEQLEAVGV